MNKTSTFTTVRRNKDRLIYTCFSSDSYNSFPAITLYLTFSILVGLYLFRLLFNDGVYSFIKHDWLFHADYYSALKDAFEKLEFPFYLSEKKHGTNFLWGNPQVIISPQLLLLAFQNYENFMFSNLLILYSFGAWGIWKLGKEYKLSLFTGCIILMLFSFSGKPICHIAGGQIEWMSFYFIPFALLYFLRLTENRDKRTRLL